MKSTNLYYVYNRIQTIQHTFSLEEGCNVLALCDALHIHLIPYDSIHFKHLCTFSQEGFSCKKDERYYIVYNSNIYNKRLIFTIAHELGHILLGHHEITPELIHSPTKHYVLEKHANIFAQNLLMPVEATKRYLKQGADAGKLSTIFNVSKTMAQVRINKLYHDALWLRKIKHHA